jgi:hypothetical protein
MSFGTDSKTGVFFRQHAHALTVVFDQQALALTVLLHQNVLPLTEADDLGLKPPYAGGPGAQPRIEPPHHPLDQSSKPPRDADRFETTGSIRIERKTRHLTTPSFTLGLFRTNRRNVQLPLKRGSNIAENQCQPTLRAAPFDFARYTWRDFRTPAGDFSAPVPLRP